MPYTIKKFNGQTLTVIEDGTVDTTSTNLNLPGKNYAGYGKAQNESLVYLLENFANSVEPSRKLTGQLWYDSTSKKIKVYDGTKFRSLGSIEYGITAPDNQVIGDQWFNTTTNQLFVWNGTVHKLIGPLQVGANTSQLVSKKLLDTGGNSQTVLEAVVGNTVVAMFSEAEFDINPTQTPVTGYEHIYKGINLPSTTTYPNIQFAGVAKTSKSLLVNGIEISAEQFVQNTSTTTQRLNSSLYVQVSPDPGITAGTFANNRGLFVGSSQDLYLSAYNGNGYVTNLTGDSLIFSVQSSGASKRILTIQPDNVSPTVTNSIDLGTTGRVWNRVLAHNFFATPVGSEDGAFNGKVLGTTVSASVGFIGNLTGNIKGNVTRTINGATQTVLDITGSNPAFNGVTTGEHIGSVINPNIQDATQKYSVDTRTGTTIFRGSIEGAAASASSLTVGNTSYVGLVTSNNFNAYRNTIPVRDADGRITALEFDGVATKAGTLWAQVGPNNSYVACSPATDNTPYSVVIRDSAGDVNVGQITGTASNAQKLNNAVDSVPTQAGTIVKRDAQGDIFANLFQGVAVQANYADLAEKYLADKEYEIGTVLMIGGEAEVTACKWGKRAIGAVSASPAYLMNKDLEGGTIVALKGRIPVKVIGVIKKGDELIASDNGCAVMAVPHASGVFAIALASSEDTGVKLVECLVL